jgi:hypothetical protein
MQNIAGNCQQTLCFQMFVDNTQQCFALLPYAHYEPMVGGETTIAMTPSSRKSMVAQFFENEEADESEVISFLF